MVVMLTTAGVTRATSVATSGVPARTGGDAKGGGAGAGAALEVGPVARAVGLNDPAARQRAAETSKEPIRRLAMVVASCVSAMFPTLPLFTSGPSCQAHDRLKISRGPF